MANLAVECIDMRGTDRVPYGYVEFSDGTRVGFTPDLEAEIWPSNHGDITLEHFRLAANILVEKGLLHTGPVRFRINHPALEILAVEPDQLR